MTRPTIRLALTLGLALALPACNGRTSAEQSAPPVDAHADMPSAAATEHTATPTEDHAMTSSAPSGFFALKTASLAGEPVDLSQYAGKVVLVVNVASECGYTPQYAGLQELYADHESRGLVVLGFPSNEFGGQEPGTPEQIQQFCSSKFGVGFPLMDKCEVKPGASQSPVYAFLEAQTGEVPNWNFCKYLVGRDGKVIGFYASKVAPDAKELRDAIQGALG